MKSFLEKIFKLSKNHQGHYVYNNSLFLTSLYKVAKDNKHIYIMESDKYNEICSNNNFSITKNCVYKYNREVNVIIIFIDVNYIYSLMKLERLKKIKKIKLLRNE